MFDFRSNPRPARTPDQCKKVLTAYALIALCSGDGMPSRENRVTPLHLPLAHFQLSSPLKAIRKRKRECYIVPASVGAAQFYFKLLILACVTESEF